MLSRRETLLTVVGTVLAQWPDAGRAATTGKPIRADATSAKGKEMLKIYAEGVKLMKELTTSSKGKDPTCWNFQWYVHSPPDSKNAAMSRVFGSDKTSPHAALALASWQTCQAHFSGDETSFLPWHRIYVMYLERIVRAVTKEKGFALPYWNYTPQNLSAIPPEFRTAGPLFQANRNPGVNSGTPIANGLPPNTLNLDAMDESGYSLFNSRLDNGLHGNIHVLTGDPKNMGSVPTAAEDPIFWLHHCNIDRIWAGWNAAGRTNPTDQGWRNRKFVFANSAGQSVTVPFSEIADYGALDYAYDVLPTPPTRAMTVAEKRSEPSMTVLESTSGGTAREIRSPITFTDRQQTVALQPTAPESSLARSVPGAPSTGPVYLVLNDVQAAATPGSLVGVYLNLPDNASDQVKEEHFVGMLNFFSASRMEGMDHGGRQVVFNISDLVRRLDAGKALSQRTTVTFVPFGSPAPGSEPKVMGDIEIQRQ